MTTTDRHGCTEDSTAGLSRRGLLRLAVGAAAATTMATATTLGGARVAMAAGGTTGDVLVVVSLRGGMDGLSLVVPHGDPSLATWRPSIAVPGARTKQVDGMFGLHPAMAPLFGLWDSGRLGAVHACGMVAANRSHFEAMEEMEEAAPDSSLRTGWIDRMVGVTGSTSPFTATGIGLSAVPTALSGSTPELVAQSLASVGVTVDAAVPLSAWRDSLVRLHDGERPEVSRTTHLGMRAAEALQGLPAAGTYPSSRLAAQLSDVARLVKADLGVRVATVDFGGWDMHSGLGTADPGRWMYDQVATLSAALAAFAADLGPLLDRVCVVTLSEFGRRVQQNSSGGVDHGYGNAVLVLGGGIRGGVVHGRWPGLAESSLVAGDLAVTTDYRDVLAELLSVRCGVPSAASQVFPGLRHAPLGIARPLA